MIEMLKKQKALLFMLVMLFMLAGCNATSDKEQTNPENNANSTESSEQEQKDVAEAFPVTITDGVGREVTIEKEPEKIVSIQASNTEILYALGVGDRLVGVSDYCNYPEEAQKVQKVGGQDMNAELILSLLPDVAFVTVYHYENHKDILEQYEQAGIQVVVTGNANSFQEAYDTMKMMGAATGTAAKAEEIVTDMEERRKAIAEKAKAIENPKKVWIEVSPAPDIFTTGRNTFMHEMLETIQAVNAAEEQEGWVKMTEEEIVQLNPDIIITTYGYYVENPEEGVLARDGWQEVKAIQEKQVFDVDNDTVTRPGPRLIEGVERLAELVYPEVFKK